jgi:hypothetical protein
MFVIGWQCIRSHPLPSCVISGCHAVCLHPASLPVAFVCYCLDLRLCTTQVLRVEFLNRLVLEHVQVACQALVHLCFMNAQLSVTLCTSLRNSVVTATQHTVSADLKPFFKALSVSVGDLPSVLVVVQPRPRTAEPRELLRLAPLLTWLCPVFLPHM